MFRKEGSFTLDDRNSSIRSRRLTERLNDFRAAQPVANILQGEINSRVLPFVVNRRSSIRRHNDLVTGIRSMARSMLDGEIGPRPGDHQRVDAEALQNRVQLRPVKA